MTGAPWFEAGRNINCFLGYRSIYRKLDIDDQILEAATSSPETRSKQELVNQGVDALTTTFDRAVGEYGDDVTHVLPLSGGLDSRTILGGLLDTVPAEQIVTVTFGTPGSWDFEIGRQVGHAVGTRHFTVDLRPESFPWTEERLIQSASEYSRPTKLFRARTSLDFAFEKLREHHDITNPVYWSGFLGDAITGDHLPAEESKTWSAACERFEHWTCKAPHLTSPEFNPASVLPDEPAVDRDVLTFDDQLDFGVRQPYFIEPAATFNDRFAAPFNEEPFLSFMLNVPREHRIGRSLFEEIVAKAYPELFSLPAETKAGLPLGSPDLLRLARLAIDRAEYQARRRLGRERPARSTSHLDWNVELRRSEPLKQLVEQQLSDLADRRRVPWLDVWEIYSKHQNGSNRGQDILLLTSLELFLKSEN